MMNVSLSPKRQRLFLASALLAGSFALMMPAPAAAELAISVSLAPPILPIYAQPPMPAAGYLWTPGYWANDGQGYYWVPGTWVQPPSIGVLWTPPYWGWEGGVYLFHGGYWGAHVGFYGGVNYGFGYGGAGYQGGRWDGDHFAYNRTVNNFGGNHVTNVYSSPVTINNHSRVSYVGGTNGLHSQPTAADHIAEQEQHVAATHDQVGHAATAAQRPELAAAQNHGRPAIAATAHPGEFEGKGVVPARAPARQAARPAAAAHPQAAHAQAAPARPAPAAAHPEAAPHQQTAQRPAPAAHPAEGKEGHNER